MKFFTLVLLSLLTGIGAGAQQMPVLAASTSHTASLATAIPSHKYLLSNRGSDGANGIQRELYKIPKAPGERRMKVGRTLAGFGAATVVAGLLVYNNRDPEYYTKNSFGTAYVYDPNEVGGQMLVGIGTGLIVPGVMIWIHGASIYKRHERKQMQALYIPAGKLGLAYRF